MGDGKFKKGCVPWNKGRFDTGCVPWNKGRKMDVETYDKVKHTFFKAGGLPPTTKYFGKPYLYVRTRKDGTIEKSWLIHIGQRRLFYLKYLCCVNGVDLKGMKPRLKEGVDINQVPRFEDIVVVTSAEHMRLNSMHRFPEEVRGLIRIKGLLTRQINKNL